LREDDGAGQREDGEWNGTQHDATSCAIDDAVYADQGEA
jgi:hypothetical protein